MEIKNRLKMLCVRGVEVKMSAASLYTPLPLEAAVFGQPHGEVTLLQTHIGCVYLVGEYAFKIKKQVRFDFLDFTTLDQRKWACEREVQLNTRLCPDLYLGVCPIVEDSNGRLRVEINSLTVNAQNAQGRKGKKGRTVDYAVWMRRLDVTRMLDYLLQAPDAVTLEDAQAIARVLVPFYQAQRGKIASGGLGDFECVQANVEENLREGLALDRALLPQCSSALIQKRARYFLSHHGDILKQRAREGFIVDGHGDLRSENICLPLSTLDLKRVSKKSRPYLFDCIEFNDRFRVCDSALDIAFLAMDLDSRGRADLSTELLEVYRRECDPQLPADVLTFYLGYRAFVKGKVAAWITSDKAVSLSQRQRSAEQARGLFDLAVGYALKGRPILLVFCGLSGSGKSTLASGIAKRLRCVHFATDLIRDEILSKEMPSTVRYSAENAQRVYAELLSRVSDELAARRIVVIEGTFTSSRGRRQFAQIAQSLNATAILVWTDCPSEKIEEHLQARSSAGQLFGSEATADVSARQRAVFETPEASELFDAICRIDTAQELTRAQETTWARVCECLSTIDPHTANAILSRRAGQAERGG